jgi:hypothetical protein
MEGFMKKFSAEMQALIDTLNLYFHLPNTNMLGKIDLNIVNATEYKHIITFERMFNCFDVRDNQWKKLFYSFKTGEVEILGCDYSIPFKRKASFEYFEYKFRHLINVEETLITLQEKLIGLT